MRTPGQGLAVAAWAGLAVVIALEGIAGARGDAAVADEHPHIASGLLYASSGRFSGGLDNPPLGQLLVALPVWWAHPEYRFAADEALPWARLPVIVLTVGLALLLAAWVARRAGRWAGAGLLLLFALEPNLLAHGHLATLDAPVTFFWWVCLACVVGTVPGSSRSVLEPRRWGRRRLLLGVGALLALSAAVWTKFSGLLLVPVLAVAIVLGGPPRGWPRAFAALGGALVAAILLGHVVYAFEPARWGLPEHAIAALRGKWAHTGEGHVAYLHGRTSVTGFWHYDLVALVLKTPLHLLVLAAVGAVAGRHRRSRLENALLAATAGVVLLAFTLVRVDIGVRHLLPLMPVLLVLATDGLQRLLQGAHAARALAVGLLVYGVVDVGRVLPQSLAYFNALAGGPAGGHHWLIDSNLDWGQDDRRLARFLEARRAAGETDWQVLPDPYRARPGRIAVNVNSLHGVMRRDAAVRYAWLRSFAPRGHAGWSWKLYALTLADFERAVAERPDAVRAWVAWAQALDTAGERGRAREVLDQAATRFSAAPEVAAEAAFVALRDSSWESARTWARRGLYAAPEDPRLQRLLERARLEARLARPESSRLERARAWHDLGLLEDLEGHHERAVQRLRRACELAPEAVDARGNLAVALARAGRLRAALDVLGDAPALSAERNAIAALLHTRERLRAGDPDLSAEALMRLADHAFRSGRWDAAAEALVAALRREPDRGEALALLSEIAVRAKLRVITTPLTPRALLTARRSDLERGHAS